MAGYRRKHSPSHAGFRVFWLMASGLSITAGYHRLWAHTTYQANPVIKVFLLLFGAAAFEGSALEWCTDHRNHHRYVDTARDPYNINRGFWYAHIGWLMILDPNKRNFENVEDMSTDYLIRFQHKYYSYVAIFMGFILPTLIAALWHDWMGGLDLGGCCKNGFKPSFYFLYQFSLPFIWQTELFGHSECS